MLHLFRSNEAFSSAAKCPPRPCAGCFRIMTDTDFLAAFETRSLPFAQWTHRAHVKVAFLYLRGLPLAAALDKIRARIRAYNAANAVPESPTSGYNETTTV